MLDLTTPAWAATLAPGDIVSFEFPVVEDDAEDHIKKRPCLVFDRRTFGDEEFVDLAYGTTQFGDSNRGYEIRLRHQEDFLAAGLRHPTRFIGARRVLVHPRHPGFHTVNANGPVIGRLPPTLLQGLGHVRSMVGQAMIQGWRRQPKCTVIRHLPTL